MTPQNRSPANDFRSDDCNELLARELADLDEAKQEELEDAKCNLVSQASIEIDICDDEQKESNGAPSCCDIKEEVDVGEVRLKQRQIILFVALLKIQFFFCCLCTGLDHFRRSLRCAAIRC